MDSPQPKRSFKRSIDEIITVFTKRKIQEVEAVKSALYNVGVLVILAAFAAVFLVLLPFLNPLLWAFLLGAVLFPAKQKLSNAINSWLDKLATNETPITLGILSVPVNIIVDVGEKLTGWLLEHAKNLFIGICSLIGLRLIIYYVPSEAFSSVLGITLRFYSLFDAIVNSLSFKLLLFVIAGYATFLFFFWNSSSSKAFTISGQVVWILIAAYCCSFLGSLQTPALVGVMAYGLVGFIYDIESDTSSQIVHKLKNIVSPEKAPPPPVPEVHEPSPSPEPPQHSHEFLNTPRIGALMKDKLNLSEIKERMKLNIQEKKSQSTTTIKKEELESDLYLRILMYACMFTICWNQIWILFLSFIPICIFSIKELVKILGFIQFLEIQFNNHYTKLIEWLEPRRSAVFPVCYPGVRKINKKLHKIFCQQSKLYVDDISAITMILFLIFAVIFLSVFLFFQIYAETITVAQLGSNLINRTLTHSPELVEMLPINMQSMNDAIDNAYKYSREKIEEYVDNVFNQTNPEQASKLKYQILSLWDRLIQSYMDKSNDSNSIGPRVGIGSVWTTLDEIFVTSEVTAEGLIHWMKSNVGLLMEVGDSIWMVLKANMSLLFSTATTLFSVVFGGGQAMIKFIFNIIIFLTTLFYLLRSSQDRYVTINMNSGLGSKLADALEDSVSSVLVATMKLSIFHGLFTWFTHTVFGAHVVYLPSILASILAAAPFVETYWCSLPAFLDLWLSQDRLYLGVTLILVHFIIPSNFNPIVHSEIKGGGHPFLTALSIVGGMYLFGGIEGAIYGPLLLCLLIVLSSMTMHNLNSAPSSLTRQSSLEESNSEISSPKT